MSLSCPRKTNSCSKDRIQLTDYIKVSLSVSIGNNWRKKRPVTYAFCAALTALLGASFSGKAQMNQFNGLNQNYIVNNTIQISGVTTEAGVNALPVQGNNQVIQYFDGLGRPLQTVTTQSSPLQKDVVQPVVYDAFGREAFRYLPYVSSQNNGWYKVNPVGTNTYTGSDHFNFYNNTSDNIADDNAFAETRFEASPLNRVTKSGAPGAVWQPDGTLSYSSTDRTIKKAYEFNTANEVLKWTYTAPSSAYTPGLVNATTSYGENRLYKNKTKDEHHHQVIEYADLEGRVVLKRVQAVPNGANEAPPPINDINYASTYYVYDDLGQLVCVIQPEGVRLISESAANYFSKSEADKHAFLKQWAFRYTYDALRRMTLKQVPGAEPVYMIYDNRDRLVMTQDGNQRTITTTRPIKEWTFTRYDNLNRPVITGIYASNTPADQTQTGLTNSTSVTSESYTITGPAFGYTSQSFPTDADINKYLTVTYYDIYDSNIAPAAFAPPANQGLPGEIAATQNPKKQKVTGTLVKNLGTDTWLRTVNYYDDKYRIIYSIAEHQKSTLCISSNVYDFTGKMLFTQKKYTINGAVTTVKESFAYDHAGRLVTLKHSLNGTPDVVIAAHYYNELGELVSKGLHATNLPPIDPQIGQPGTVHGAEIERDEYNASETALIATQQVRLLPGFHKPATNIPFRAAIGVTPQEANTTVLGNFRQVIDYRYNIRGWLTRINNSDISTVADGNNAHDLFGMEFSYNAGFNGLTTQSAYNGNISSIKWSKGISSAGALQAYTFQYDELNRLKAADHFDSSVPSSTWLSHGNAFGESETYDLNGNIKRCYAKELTEPIWITWVTPTLATGLIM